MATAQLKLKAIVDEFGVEQVSDWASSHFCTDAEVDEAGDIWFNNHWANQDEILNFVKSI